MSAIGLKTPDKAAAQLRYMRQWYHAVLHTTKDGPKLRRLKMKDILKKFKAPIRFSETHKPHSPRPWFTFLYNMNYNLHLCCLPFGA